MSISISISMIPSYQAYSTSWIYEHQFQSQSQESQRHGTAETWRKEVGGVDFLARTEGGVWFVGRLID